MYSVWKQSIHLTINHNLHSWINTFYVVSSKLCSSPQKWKILSSPLVPRATCAMCYMSIRQGQPKYQRLLLRFLVFFQRLWAETEIREHFCSGLQVNCRSQAGRSVPQTPPCSSFGYSFIKSLFPCWDGNPGSCRFFFSLPRPLASSSLQAKGGEPDTAEKGTPLSLCASVPCLEITHPRSIVTNSLIFVKHPQ